MINYPTLDTPIDWNEPPPLSGREQRAGELIFLLRDALCLENRAAYNTQQNNKCARALHEFECMSWLDTHCEIYGELSRLRRIWLKLNRQIQIRYHQRELMGF